MFNPCIWRLSWMEKWFECCFNYVKRATRKKSMHLIAYFKKPMIIMGFLKAKPTTLIQWNWAPRGHLFPWLAHHDIFMNTENLDSKDQPAINSKARIRKPIGDPYICCWSVHKNQRQDWTALSLVGHLPREVSRFCKFFFEYGGDIESTVSDF